MFIIIILGVAVILGLLFAVDYMGQHSNDDGSLH